MVRGAMAGLMLLGLVSGGCGAHQVAVQRPLFRGYEAISLENQVSRVTVVPRLGRVTELVLLKDGAAQGPVWVNPALAPGLAADATGWSNFGGEKTWPAPQDEWAKLTGSPWPPPETFDATPFSETVVDRQIEIVSAVDPHYGIQVRRRIVLDPALPVLTIETRYEKVQGRSVTVAVWTIAQLMPPDRMFVRLPERSVFPGGYRNKLPAAPRDLRVDGRLLSMARDPLEKTQIATDGDALLWVGAGPDLLVEALDARGAPPPSGTSPWARTSHEYPSLTGPKPKPSSSSDLDWPGGVHAQIYTSPDGQQRYVELELLGRLHRLGPGDSASFTVRYTLVPRSEGDPTREARKVLHE
jgi:hypothetical protein